MMDRRSQSILHDMTTLPHPALPAPFESRFAGLREIAYTGPGTRFHECFGCGPNHDMGLRVRTFRGDGEVLSPIVIPKRFEGPPKGAHGGIVAAYLDEVMSGAAGALRRARAGGAPAPRPRPRRKAGREVSGPRSHARGSRDGRGRGEGN